MHAITHVVLLLHSLHLMRMCRGGRVGVGVGNDVNEKSGGMMGMMHRAIAEQGE